jgi:colicin import membrane protein
MPSFFQEHLRPLAGAAALHVGLVGLLALAAMKWTSTQPPVEIAIQGYVAELPPSQGKAAKPRSAPPPPPAPVPKVEAPPEPAPEPKQAQRAEVERERAQVEARAAEAREAEVARERAAAEKRRAEEAVQKRAAEAESKRKAEAAERQKAEDAERKKVEAAEAKRKADDKARAEREARADAERQAELQRSLAAEEEEAAAAVARSGVMDEYRRLLVQTIERNWIRPPSARSGLECTLYVTQAPGGTVVDVKLGSCNGDQAVRESITTAVFKSSPLPAPRDPRAFERRLEIVFKPTE